ncbi:hypothetical protein [Actinoplanes sp. NPDC051494]|uniref:hypothetical protein n=1 Tax=Actinoplanes sp. NPDC051494 TaxID=3363907 RepID=UPI0037B1FCCE
MHRGPLTGMLLTATMMLAGCGWSGDVPESGSGLGFTRHAGAVDFPSAWDYVPAGT